MLNPDSELLIGCTAQNPKSEVQVLPESTVQWQSPVQFLHYAEIDEERADCFEADYKS